MSTVEAARDMDVLRAALGEDKARLPRLLLRHPARRDLCRVSTRRRPAGWCSTVPWTRRSGSRDGALSQAAGFETALRSYIQNCVSGGELLPRQQRRCGPEDDQGPARLDRQAAVEDQ
ncbi:hypothetical protein G5V59_15340 [Nocardioides sp. W3-2-3]|uniref:hypothetical protein n=1 Tax=Nocardioides convexus TaxID=2712224 RepID=UPI0024187A9C|nr:hypothetical protein [Nocardioides convexus]NHA00836.1 hypothetical protein [Nocardioides convexus]